MIRVVTDIGADLPSTWTAEHDVSVIPLHLTWEDGKPADSVGRPEFYERLATEKYPPKTSQPSIGEFQRLYEELAGTSTDTHCLSIHISSGLSGTAQSARAAAALVPQANVTVIDTLTLSGAEGWQVRTAANAARAGLPLDAILEQIRRVREATDTVYTLDTLHYLMLGGRIGRVKGTIGTLLHIKPMIAVEKEHGTYIQVGTGRSLKQAMRNLASHVAKHIPEGTPIVAQVLHAEAPELAAQLRDVVDQMFTVHWLPLGEISPVLGAHTGPSLVGLVYADRQALAGIDLD